MRVAVQVVTHAATLLSVVESPSLQGLRLGGFWGRLAIGVTQLHSLFESFAPNIIYFEWLGRGWL